MWKKLGARGRERGKQLHKNGAFAAVARRPRRGPPTPSVLPNFLIKK
jgi:hypothetical protein